jgi:hypothetical protein
MIINIFYYLQNFLWKKEKKKSSRYHCCSNVWNNEDSNAFSVKLGKKKNGQSWVLLYGKKDDVG